MIDAVLNALGECHSLLLTRNDEDDLSGVHYRGDTDRERHPRNSREVVVKESSIGEDRVIRKCLDASARDERRSRLFGPSRSVESWGLTKTATHFVECQVTILPHSTEEDVDASYTLDLALVFGALVQKVLGLSVQNVGVLGRDVDLGEEVGVHECMVRFRVVAR